MGAPAGPARPPGGDAARDQATARKVARDGTLGADLRDGLRFVHELEANTRHDAFETAVSVLALLEELAQRGAIDPESVARRAEGIRTTELDRMETHARVRILDSVDKYALEGLPDIDCTARFPLCQARCCKLHFALTKQDLDERVVKWDSGRPYLIRQREHDGFCVHNDRETGACGVYTHRPAVCRTYDCRDDKRIWVDFDRRIPAPLDPLPQALELVKRGG